MSVVLSARVCALGTLIPYELKHPVRKRRYLMRVLYHQQNPFDPGIIGFQCPFDGPSPVVEVVLFADLLAAASSPIVAASRQKFLTPWLGPTVNDLPSSRDYMSTA